MIDLADYDPVNSRAEVCIGLLSRYRKQGLATAALQLLCEYAMKKLHLHQLYAYIPKKNDESHNLFSKNGFEKSALLKDWQRTEKGFNDVILVQKIAEK